MSFLSLHFAVMTAVLFVFYYKLPKRFRPYLLLAGSLYFYYCCSGLLLLVMAGTSFAAFVSGKLLYKYRPSESAKSSCERNTGSKILCGISVLLLLSPLVFLKYSGFLLRAFLADSAVSSLSGGILSVGLPIGISFYTLQLISYILDIYRKKYAPESDFFRFLLFTCFFPQVLQGPIPRFDALKETLFSPHEPEEKTIAAGLMKILFGLFLKLMLADKAALFVNTVFNTEEKFAGSVYLTAGILYSFQLYADFLSCVLLAQGTALLFGIRLAENFAQPYFASSIKEFWRRWHISLSSWLRDYVYIPLGGSRKGIFRTDCNLLLTFLVSGIWHGSGFKYLFWGMLHGGFQIAGKHSLPVRDRFFAAVRLPLRARAALQKITTFFLVMTAWIIFRANSLRDGLYALYAVVFDFRAESLLSSFTSLGLSLPEWLMLLLTLILLYVYDSFAERGKPLYVRLSNSTAAKQLVFALLLLLFAAIFGTYGFGYDANAFIYGGF